MDKIELDCTKLLGFKIIADDGSTVRLSSPKIGDKDCPSFNQDLRRPSIRVSEPAVPSLPRSASSLTDASAPIGRADRP